MTKRGKWSEQEDAFLMFYEDAVGANYVATHDLGRANGSGDRRIKKLKESGAYALWLKSEIKRAQYLVAAGHVSEGVGNDSIERFKDKLDRHYCEGVVKESLANV